MVPKLCVSRFHLPKSKRSSAADPIDFGQKGLHFIIAIFAPLLMDIKPHKEFKAITEKIEKHLKKNNERLKLCHKDVDFVHFELGKLMKEKGIKELENGERLLVTLFVIAVKRSQIIKEIKMQNSILHQKMLSAIKNDKIQ